MRKLLILLILVGVLISGCAEEMKPTELEKEISKSDSGSMIYNVGDYDIFLDRIAITFNNKEKGYLIASSVLNRTRKQPRGINYDVNNDFRNFFSDDVTVTIDDIDGIINITNIHFLTLIDSASMKLVYMQDLTNEEKKSYLDKFKEKLESKWYTEHVAYDTVLHLG